MARPKSPASGERHPMSRLSAEQVEIIRRLNERDLDRYGYKRIAKLFGVGISTVRDVCTYRTW